MIFKRNLHFSRTSLLILITSLIASSNSNPISGISRRYRAKRQLQTFFKPFSGTFSNKFGYNTDMIPSYGSRLSSTQLSEIAYRPPSESSSMDSGFLRNIAQSPLKIPRIAENGGFQSQSGLLSNMFGNTNNFQSSFGTSLDSSPFSSKDLFADSYLGNFGLSQDFKLPSVPKPIQQNNFGLSSGTQTQNFGFSNNFSPFSSISGMPTPVNSYNSQGGTFSRNSEISSNFGLPSSSFMPPVGSFSMSSALPTNFQSSFGSSLFSPSGTSIQSSSITNLFSPTFKEQVSSQLRQNSALQETLAKPTTTANKDKLVTSLADSLCKSFNLANSFTVADIYNDAFKNIRQGSSINEYIAALAEATDKLLKRYNILNENNKDQKANLAATAINNAISLFRKETESNPVNEFMKTSSTNWNSNFNMNASVNVGQPSAGAFSTIDTFKTQNGQVTNLDISPTSIFKTENERILPTDLLPTNNFKTESPTEVRNSFTNSLFLSIISSEDITNFLQKVTKEKADVFALKLAKSLGDIFGFKSNVSQNKYQTLFMSSAYPLEEFSIAHSLASAISENLSDEGVISSNQLTKNVDDTNKAIRMAMSQILDKNISSETISTNVDATSQNKNMFSGTADLITQHPTELEVEIPSNGKAMIDKQTKASANAPNLEELLQSKLTALGITQLINTKQLTEQTISRIAKLFCELLAKELKTNITPEMVETFSKQLKFGAVDATNLLLQFSKAIATILGSKKDILTSSTENTVETATKILLKCLTEVFNLDVKASPLEAAIKKQTQISVESSSNSKIAIGNGETNEKSAADLKLNLGEDENNFQNAFNENKSEKESGNPADNFGQDLILIKGDKSNYPEQPSEAKKQTTSESKLVDNKKDLYTTGVSTFDKEKSNINMSLQNKEIDQIENSKILSTEEVSKNFDKAISAGTDNSTDETKVNLAKKLKTKILESKILNKLMGRNVTTQQLSQMADVYAKMLSDKFNIQINEDKRRAINTGFLNFRNDIATTAEMLANSTAEVLNKIALNKTRLEETVNTVLNCLSLSLSQTYDDAESKDSLKSTLETNRDSEVSSTADTSADINVNNRKFQATIDSFLTDTNVDKTKTQSTTDNIRIGMKGDSSKMYPSSGIQIQSEQDQNKQLENEGEQKSSVESQRSETEADLKSQFVNTLKQKVLETGIFEKALQKDISKDIVTLAKSHSKLLTDKFQIPEDSSMVKLFSDGLQTIKNNSKFQDVAHILSNITADILIAKDKIKKTNLDTALSKTLGSIVQSVKHIMNSGLGDDKAVDGVTASDTKTDLIGNQGKAIDLNGSIKQADESKSSLENQETKDANSNTEIDIEKNRADKILTTKVTADLNKAATSSGANITDLDGVVKIKGTGKDIITTKETAEANFKSTSDVELKTSENLNKPQMEADLRTKFESMLKEKLIATGSLESLVKKPPMQKDIETLSKLYVKHLSDKFQIQLNGHIVQTLFMGFLSADTNEKEFAAVLAEVTADILAEKKILTASALDKTVQESVQCVLSSLSTILNGDFKAGDALSASSDVNMGTGLNMAQDSSELPNISNKDTDNLNLPKDPNVNNPKDGKLILTTQEQDLSAKTNEDFDFEKTLLAELDAKVKLDDKIVKKLSVTSNQDNEKGDKVDKSLTTEFVDKETDTTKLDTKKNNESTAKENSGNQKLDSSEKDKTFPNNANLNAELAKQTKQKLVVDLATALATSSDFKLSAMTGDIGIIMDAIAAAIEAVCGSEISAAFLKAFNASL